MTRKCFNCKESVTFSLQLKHFLVTVENSVAYGLQWTKVHSAAVLGLTRLWELITTTQRPFYGRLSRTTRVSWYQKKHSPTHHPDAHPVFISFFHPPRSLASSLFKPRAWQSFLHNLCPCRLLSASWSGALHLILHTFLHPISVFFFTAHAHTIATCFAAVSILYHLFLVFLSTPYLELCYLNITHPSDHSHLCSLKCHLI